MNLILNKKKKKKKKKKNSNYINFIIPLIGYINK